jgi:hypothetical protein
MPSDGVFQIVSGEYTDIIRTKEDFETLCSEEPESGVVRQSVKLGLTQFADRLSNPPKRSLKYNLIVWGTVLAVIVVAAIIMVHLLGLTLHDGDSGQ